MIHVTRHAYIFGAVGTWLASIAAIFFAAFQQYPTWVFLALWIPSVAFVLVFTANRWTMAAGRWLCDCPRHSKAQPDPERPDDVF